MATLLRSYIYTEKGHAGVITKAEKFLSISLVLEHWTDRLLYTLPALVTESPTRLLQACVYMLMLVKTVSL